MKVAEFKMTAAVAVHPRPKLSVLPGSLESRDTTFTENDIFFLFWGGFPKDKLENYHFSGMAALMFALRPQLAKLRTKPLWSPARQLLIKGRNPNYSTDQLSNFSRQ